MSIYSNLLSQLQNLTGNRALAVKNGKVLYAGSREGGKVIVVRNGEEHLIVKSEEPKIVSGYLQEGDQIFLEDEFGKRMMEEKQVSVSLPKISMPHLPQINFNFPTHRDFYVNGGAERNNFTKKRLLLLTTIILLAVFVYFVRKNINNRNITQQSSEEGKIITYATAK